MGRELRGYHRNNQTNNVKITINDVKRVQKQDLQINDDFDHHQLPTQLQPFSKLVHFVPEEQMWFDVFHVISSNCGNAFTVAKWWGGTV